MPVTRGQCDARPTVTFPATRLHNSLADTKLYCLATEAHVCKQPAQGCTRQRGGQDSNLRPVDHKSSILTTRPPSHTWSSTVKIPAEYQLGAHLHFQGCESEVVCDAWSLQCQTYG